MKNNYFESLETNLYNEYLMKNPTKKGCLENAKIAGRATILNNSNNRALIIDDGTTLFLQSYDTLIVSVDTFTGKVSKLWDGYTVTTLKHINTFLAGFGLNFNKKTWLNFKGTFLYI